MAAAALDGSGGKSGHKAESARVLESFAPVSEDAAADARIELVLAEDRRLCITKGSMRRRSTPCCSPQGRRALNCPAAVKKCLCTVPRDMC